MTTLITQDTPGLSEASPLSHTACRRALLKTLTYYDCFDFPLRLVELHRLLGMPASQESVRIALDALVQEGWVHQTAGSSDRFFSLRADLREVAETAIDGSPVQERRSAGELVARREQGEHATTDLWRDVVTRGQLIADFPFVKAVAVSGSLSKGPYYPGDDVDFFLITTENRLWTCRLILMLYKRLFLGGSHAMFCINYLIGESNLEVPDRNLFTATEIVWLVPMVCDSSVDRFLAANAWVRSVFPNWRPDLKAHQTPWNRSWHNEQRQLPELRKQNRTDGQQEKPLVSRAIGLLLQGPCGAPLEGLSRWLITKRNRSRYAAQFTPEQYAQAMRSESSVSKHHPRNQQERILERFSSRWGRLRSNWENSRPTVE